MLTSPKPKGPSPFTADKDFVPTPNPKLKKGQINETTRKYLSKSIPRSIPAHRSVDLNAFAAKISAKDRPAR